MYTRMSKIMFPVLFVVLIGVWSWGYLGIQEKKRLQIKVENQYQRAFHELSTNIEKMNDELGHSMVLSSVSKNIHRKGLVNAWRYAHLAKSNITHLPLGAMPIHDTEKFLANVAQFSYEMSVRDHEKQPLNQIEIDKLHTLYQHSKAICESIQYVQSQVLEKNLRWMDVESALSAKDIPENHMIIDGFSSVDKNIGSFSDVDWGSGMMELYHTNRVQMIVGEDKNIEEIKEKAIQLFGLTADQQVEVNESGHDGIGFGSYRATIRETDSDDNPIYMNFTKKGGHLTFLSHSREVIETKLDARRARDLANEFLEQKGYVDMTAVHYEQHHHVADLVFVKRQGEILIYPQQIRVMVALDNGEIIGLQVSEYVFASKDRNVEPMTVSMEEARKQIHDDFEITRSRKVIIFNSTKQEVPCYEFSGKIHNQEYRIYINGHTGAEELIETIRAKLQE